MYFTHSSTFHFILIYSYTARMNISIDILQFINCFQEQLVLKLLPNYQRLRKY